MSTKLNITGGISLNTYNKILSIPIRECDRALELIQEQSNTDKPYIVEIKQKPVQRSKNANDYSWVLCQKIAKVLSKEYPISKDDVYVKTILESNYYVPQPIKDEALEKYQRIWEGKGLGWICQIARKSHLEGFTTVRCYYGSSAYDTKEMSNHIDRLIEEAKELGIETKTPQELAALKEQWK